MINSLTSMRFFAALLVFIYHYEWLDINFSTWLLADFWINLTENGYIGVSFFYVLSGFVLSNAYEKKFNSTQVTKRKFYIARVARIYPLHLATLILAIPLMSSSPWKEAIYTAFPFNLTLTHSFVPSVNYYFSYNSPSWSISNEFFFYALFPFLTCFRTKILGTIMVIISVIIFITWSIGQYIDWVETLYHWTFYINPTFRMMEFVMGVITYRLVAANDNIFDQIKWPATLFELVALLLLMASIYFIDQVPGFLSLGYFFAPFFALVILVFSYQAGYISNTISNRALVYLGEISFAVYMFHQILFRYMKEYFVPSFVIENPAAGFLGVLLVVILLSSLSFHFLETPANKWIKAKAARNL